MLYAKKISETEAGELISEKQLRIQMPNVMLPENLTDELLAYHGYVQVHPIRTTLQQTYDKIISFRASYNGNRFIREAFLKPVSVEEATDRKKRQLMLLRNTRNMLLTESDFTQNDDYFELKEEWKVYRQQLRDITTTYSDPYIAVIPKKPSVDGSTRDIETHRKYTIAKIKSNFLKDSYRPKVPTPLGFTVDGSHKDLQNFQAGKQAELLIIRDAYNDRHNISLEDYDIIIKTIIDYGVNLTKKKWDNIALANGATTIEQLNVIISK